MHLETGNVVDFAARNEHLRYRDEPALAGPAIWRWSVDRFKRRPRLPIRGRWTGIGHGPAWLPWLSWVHPAFRSRTPNLVV